jgi:sarcosine oxidase
MYFFSSIEQNDNRCSSHSTPIEVWDIIIVGGGVMGSSASVAAAKRGLKCLLIDQFEPGHDNGSSHGDGRIYRFAYREKVYIDMQRLALTLWDELEAKTETKVYERTGGLDIAAEGNKVQN